MFYFIGRIETYMTRALQQPRTDRTIWFNPGTKSLPSLASGPDGQPAVARALDAIHAGGRNGARQAPRPEHASNATPGEYLNASQEEYFLGLFWHSHHCSLQIVDEAAFREHYRSLCSDAPPGTFRRPSALVDAIVALCMQYGVAFLPRRGPVVGASGGEDGAGPEDGALAGWWHYQRCRVMLESEMERPTLSTLQTLVFSVIYLCCASFQNTAHNMLALAVRVGYTLGLHLEPPEDMSWSDRELRKRLWWAVCVTEAKTCMKLGRPWSTTEALTPCTLPADDHELALRSGPNTACITSGGSTVTWLTYTLQNARLVLAARTVYVSFFDRCAEILSRTSTAGSLHDDPAALELAADALERCMDGPAGLRAWMGDLPAAVKTQRVDQGVPLSTDLSRLDIEMFAPAWLQRQRLFLELLYHTLMINLHRPFISFPPALLTASSGPTAGCSPVATPVSSSGGPLAVAHASTAARHAIAITAVIHQAVAETDLLKGWHEAFQQQWNAAITMVGFLLAFPASPVAADARTALAGAIDVFEAFGKHFSVGSSAANATRDLLSKAELVRAAAVCEPQQPSAEFRSERGAGHGRALPEPLSMREAVGEHEDMRFAGVEAQTALPPLPVAMAAVTPDPSHLGAFLTHMSDEEVAAAVRDMLAGTIDMVYSVDSFQATGAPHMGMDAYLSGLY